MNERAAPVDPLADALLALRLFLTSPDRLCGLCLRGAGPARDLVLEELRSALEPGRLHRMPLHIDDDRLLGGIDVAASLAAGQAIRQRGFLVDAAGGVILVSMAERLPAASAGRLAQALDRPGREGRFGLVLLDDGLGIDECPPPSLTERLAFVCDLSQARALDAQPPPHPEPLAVGDVVEPDDTALASLAATARALGIASIRPMLFAIAAAQAHAALNGRDAVAAEDLAAAARLVLAPRATQLPPQDKSDDAPPPPEPPGSEDETAEREEQSDIPLDDIVLEAAAAAIPPDLLARMAEGLAQRGAGGSGAGRKRKSQLRGRPLAARPGTPDRGARLALVDTLRAAVPWQPLRRRERPDDGTNSGMIVRKDDLRVRRFEERAGTVTIFCVDASGSAALARLAEAKGAVELMLAQAYVTRSEVALIAFRGEQAELLLPPTRSLTRARRALAQLPGGGGTPLAAGLGLARELGELTLARGRTPFLVFLTDGRANIAADGTPGRAKAAEDVQAAAGAIARGGFDAMVIDISPRPSPEAGQLAKAMRARFLALPAADAGALHAAVAAARPAMAS